MFMCNGKRIRPGRGFTDANGLQHPGNWTVYSPAERERFGIIEVPDEAPAPPIPQPTTHRPKESSSFQSVMRNKEKYYAIVS